MFSILAGLKRPTARLATALGISLTLIGSSLQLPISSADSVARPLHVDVTQQITSAGDDVNEDGSSFDADYEYIWLGTGANPSASYTGLRFANLAVPQGATITTAKLQVYLSSSSWSSLSFDYFAENSGNSAAFSTSNRPSQRTLTSQNVSHSSDVNWPANTWIDLDEISSVIQPVISRSDWTSGNALSIILKGVGGAWGRKYVTAYDGAAAYAIRLAISYTTSGPTPTNTVVALTNTPTATRTNTPVGPTATAVGGGTQLPRQVVGSSDDVNEDGTGFEADYGTVWFGTGANPSASYTGLRFTNITIPQGATITSAKLQIYLSNSSWNQLSFDYFAENTGNSVTFSASSRPSQRALTSQSVSHSSDVNWPANTWIDLDEISSVVQPVISRNDWTSGNALSIILKGVGGAYGRKFVTAYDGTPTNAVRLVIVYAVSAATATRTSTASATAMHTATATVSPTSTQTPLPTTTPTNTPTWAPGNGDGYPGPGDSLEQPAITGPYKIMIPAVERGIPTSVLSRYVDDTSDTAMRNLGASRGGCNSSGQRPTGGGLTVLAFGMAATNGTTEGVQIYATGYPFRSAEQIETAMINFIDSYVDCVKALPGISLTVALGVNNSPTSTGVTYNNGVAWANTVNRLRYYINHHSPVTVTINGQTQSVTYASKIRVIAGVDFEPLFGPKDQARNWISGYNSIHQDIVLNFGTCDNCPTAAYLNNSNVKLTSYGSANADWWTDDVWYISYGASSSYALPEIYNFETQPNGIIVSPNAQQWASLSQYAATCSNPCAPAVAGLRGPIPFQGVMTTFQGCEDKKGMGQPCHDSIKNKPSDGWTFLIAEITRAGLRAPTYMHWLTDISWKK